MKILFAGPTLHGLVAPGERVPGTDVTGRAPAQQGDIARAVLDGATVIGLVDGRYEDVAAPWHKEILYALDRGVRVYGAASMGALRAAECAPFGMVPVGRIARRYMTGELTDDAAVAQLHAPPEFGCVPLTEALVNVEATVEAARASRAISQAEADVLMAAARRLFFKDRTYDALVLSAAFPGDRAETVLGRLGACRRDVKREDALELIDALDACGSGVPARDWAFKETTAWRSFMARLHDRRRAA